eukprot:GGOE01043940.1.p1 GENE.GGOE01043940.1~~GGOE01043940.1.p1  ORF type:complete len:581 (-),score=144.39 GGOE01043940.1:71-1813(-)
MGSKPSLPWKKGRISPEPTRGHGHWLEGQIDEVADEAPMVQLTSPTGPNSARIRSVVGQTMALPLWPGGAQFGSPTEDPQAPQNVWDQPGDLSTYPIPVDLNQESLIVMSLGQHSPKFNKTLQHMNTSDTSEFSKTDFDVASSSTESTGGRQVSSRQERRTFRSRALSGADTEMHDILASGLRRTTERTRPPFGIHGMPFEIMVHILKYCHQKDLMMLEPTCRSVAFCIHRDKFLHNYLRGRPESVRVRPRCQYPFIHLICIFADRLWCTFGKADILGMTPQGDTFTIFHGHEAPVTSLTALGDTYLCSASEDGTIKVWHKDVLLADPFSPTVEKNRIDVKPCSTTLNSDQEDEIMPVDCMQALGDVLVTAASDGVLRRFKVVSRDLPLEKIGESAAGEGEEQSVGHTGPVTCLVTAGEDLFSASMDRSAIRWKKDGSVVVMTLTEATTYITTMFVSQKAQTVVAGESEGGIVQYTWDWVPVRSVVMSGMVKCLALHCGMLYVGVEECQGFRQLDMYLHCVAVFQCVDDVDVMAFYGDVLFTGKNLGPMTKWIVLPPTTWPSRVPEKRGLHRSVTASLLG